MTREEFKAFLKAVDSSDFYICTIKLDKGFGVAIRGSVHEVIAHALKIITSTTEEVNDEKEKICYICAAAEKLKDVADSMITETKEKAPGAGEPL